MCGSVKVIRFISIAYIAFIVLFCSCGRLDINLHTTLTAQGNIIQEVTSTGSGKMGDYLRNNYNSQSYSGEGWQTNIQDNGDLVSITQQKVFKSDEAISLPTAATAVKNLDFHVNNYLIVKEYFLGFTLVGSQPKEPTISNEYTKWAQDIINSMFGMSWTISLPGEIIQTNADIQNGNSATWRFNAQSLEKDRYIMINSRYIDWIWIIVIGCCMAVGLWFIVHIRKGQKLRNETANMVQKDIDVSQETRMEHNITCFYHSNQNAVQICPVCKHPICIECNYGLQEKTPLCHNCFDKRRCKK